MSKFSSPFCFAQVPFPFSAASCGFSLFTFVPQSSKVSATKFNSDDGHPVRHCDHLLQRAAGGARPRRYSVPITVLSRAPKLLTSGRRRRVRPISRCGYDCILRGRASGKLRWYHGFDSSSVSFWDAEGVFLLQITQRSEKYDDIYRHETIPAAAGSSRNTEKHRRAVTAIAQHK